MSSFLINLLSLFLLLCHLQNYMGQCKTLRRDSSLDAVETRQDRQDNFVEFTDDGDQLAVESSAISEKTGQRDVVGNAAKKVSGRDCANVQQAIYPIIPVIIASVIGLVGSIIISAIAKLIFKLIFSSDDSDNDSNSGYDSSGYGRRKGYSLLGLENVDYMKLMKKVLTAIDKVY